MKYALFLYDTEDFQTLSEGEQMAIIGEYGAYSEALEKRQRSSSRSRARNARSMR